LGEIRKARFDPLRIETLIDLADHLARRAIDEFKIRPQRIVSAFLDLFEEDFAKTHNVRNGVVQVVPDARHAKRERRFRRGGFHVKC